MNAGDVIVTAVAALRVALDRAVPPAFTVTLQGDIVCTPGLLEIGKTPRSALSPKARGLLAAAKRLIDLAPLEVCAVLFGERLPQHLAELTGVQEDRGLFTLSGHGKTSYSQAFGDDDDDDDEEDERKVVYALDEDAMDITDDNDDAIYRMYTTSRDLVHPHIDREEEEDKKRIAAITQDEEEDSVIPDLPNEIADVVLQNLPTLNKLRLRCVSRLWEAKMLNAIRTIDKQLLDVLPDAQMAKLKQVTNIELSELDIHGTGKLETFFRESSNSAERGLERLVITNTASTPTSSLSAYLAAYLRYMTDLKMLQIDLPKFARPDLPMDAAVRSVLREAVEGLPKLEIFGSPLLVAPNIKYSSNLLRLATAVDAGTSARYLEPMTNLRQLMLRFEATNPAPVEHAQAMLKHLRAPLLKSVYLYNPPVDVFEDVQLIENLSDVEYLVVRKTILSEATADRFKKLPNLRKLYVSMAKISPSLVYLTKLEELELKVLSDDDNEEELVSDLNTILRLLPKLDKFLLGAPDQRIVDLADVRWKFNGLRVFNLGHAVVKIDVIVNAVPQLEIMTLDHCRLVAEKELVALPPTLREIYIIICFAENLRLMPPFALEVLRLMEIVYSMHHEHVINHVFRNDVFVTTPRVRHFTYKVEDNPSITAEKAIAYFGYANLERISTVLVGPRNEQWRDIPIDL